MLAAFVLWLVAGLPTLVPFLRRDRLGLGLATVPFAGWLALTLPWIWSALVGASVSGWWWQALVAAVLVAIVVEVLLHGTQAGNHQHVDGVRGAAVAIASTLLSAAAVAHLYVGTRLMVGGDPTIGWDGVLWLMRAKVLADLPGPYLGPLTGPQGHWDYPLLLPAWLGWLRRVGGLQLKELADGMGVVAAVVPLAGGAVLLRRGNPLLTTACLLSTFALPRALELHYGIYCDAFLTLTNTVAFLWAACAIRDRDEPLLVGAGIVLATTVALKNEGILWLIADSVAVGGYGLALRRGGRDAFAAVFRLCLPGALVFAVWQIACASLGMRNDMLMAMRWDLALSRAKGVIESLEWTAIQLGNVILPVSALLLLAGLGLGGWRRGGARVAALLVGPAIYLAGLAFMYATTPHSVQWHLLSSGDRVMWGVFPVLLSLTLFAGHLDPSSRPRDSRAA